jgi:hypothetical protein
MRCKQKIALPPQNTTQNTKPFERAGQIERRSSEIIYEYIYNIYIVDVDPLLGDDGKISDYTTAVTR